MRLFLVLVLAAAFVCAQPVTILAGSPSDQYFSTGSVAWPMPANPAPLQFLRYAPSFSYDIPLTNGFYNISIIMAEPTKTAAGQRVFTVSAQGQPSLPIDLYSLTAAQNVAYTLPMVALVNGGRLMLQFTASPGMLAVVSEIVVTPAIQASAPQYLSWCAMSTPGPCSVVAYFSSSVDPTSAFYAAYPSLAIWTPDVP